MGFGGCFAHLLFCSVFLKFSALDSDSESHVPRFSIICA